MKPMLLLFSFLTLTANAKLAKPDWTLQSGTLVYRATYPLKTVTGTSQAVKGKGGCAAGTCEFLTAVPLKSFQSGDGNRDSHMLEVTKAALYPMVTVRIKFNEPASPGQVVEARVEISLAGKSHVYENLKLMTVFEGASVKVHGTLPLVLSSFHVERPSLLGIAIEDAVPVDFNTVWN